MCERRGRGSTSGCRLLIQEDERTYSIILKSYEVSSLDLCDLPQVKRQLGNAEDTNKLPPGIESFRFPPAIVHPPQSAEAVLTSLASPPLPQKATPTFSAHRVHMTLP